MSAHRQPMDESLAICTLAALSQAMRLRIFRALIGAGPRGLTPGVLSATLEVPGSTLSFHLKELMQAGLVSQEREGRHLIYRPSLERMDGLIEYLTAHCCVTGGSYPCALGQPRQPVATSPLCGSLHSTERPPASSNSGRTSAASAKSPTSTATTERACT